MLRASVSAFCCRTVQKGQFGRVATLRSHYHAVVTTGKQEGDISNAFASLSGKDFVPLPQRFADLKGRLIQGHEETVQASWNRLLGRIEKEVAVIAEAGSSIIPEIDFQELQNPSTQFLQDHRKRGVAIVRNVIPQKTALQYKASIRDYIRANPHTKAFPPSDPQVYEIYWSASQVQARAHPNLIATQRFLMNFWHAPSSACISTSHPVSYADRLRIRQPGDASFALGPHVDGGSVERWEESGYGLGKVYNHIFHGEWESYDPWEASCRLPIVSDLYNGSSACSMFRMYQGWLSMSETGPGEGTLLVNPLLAVATAYYILRPFFSPRDGNVNDLTTENWSLDKTPTSWIQGATPGHGQELRPSLHPHLLLGKTMVHVPKVNPGDYVAWHCDTIHAVDALHAGINDASVLYIPVSPLTEHNAKYIARQREAFLNGTPGPDFPGGEGESKHLGRPTAHDVIQAGNVEGARAFGLESWNSDAPGLTPGQIEVMDRANKILGFYN